MAASNSNDPGTLTLPPSATKAEVILACLRHETSYELAAEILGISVAEVQAAETDFVAAGTSALRTSTDTIDHTAQAGNQTGAADDRISQMGALNAISQSLSAILTLDELLNTTLETLRWVFGYIPAICIVEGQDLVMKGGYALDGTVVNWYEWRLPVDTERNIIAWAAHNGRPLNVPDTSADERYFAQEAVGNVRSELAIPMMFKGTVLGVLDVKSGNPHAFDANDMSILETVAFQLAVAVENVYLFEAVRRRVAQLELIQSITGHAIKNLDVQAILEHAAQTTQSVMGYSGVAIGLLEEDGQTLALTTAANFPDKGVATDHIRLVINDSTVIGSAAQSKTMLIANEVDRDERFTLNPLFEGSKSELVIPMLAQEGMIGIINAESEQVGAFDETDVSTLTLLANQLSIAIRGAGLFQQTQEQVRVISRLLDEVQQANARFEAILETTEEGIIVWDESWRVLLANHSAAVMLNTTIETLIGCQRDEVSVSMLSEIAHATEDKRIDLSRDSRLIVVPRNLNWHSAQAAGYMTVIHNITSQVTLEETREEMTSTLVHDLRGPLAGVVGGIELAQDSISEGEDGTKIMHYLGVALRSGNLLLNMANSLLDIAKLESGTMLLECSTLQIDSIFEDVVGVVSNTAQVAGIEVQASHAKNLPAILVDNSMIRRALTNLMDNAIKFTPDGGKVILNAEREGEYIRFSVADTGPGVPEAFRRTIFDKYAQVPGQKGRRRGTGIGLAFVKLVAEAHHGRLWVEPRPEGGSIFTLVIGDASAKAED